MWCTKASFERYSLTNPCYYSFLHYFIFFSLWGVSSTCQSILETCLGSNNSFFFRWQGLLFFYFSILFFFAKNYERFVYTLILLPFVTFFFYFPFFSRTFCFLCVCIYEVLALPFLYFFSLSSIILVFFLLACFLSIFPDILLPFFLSSFLDSYLSSVLHTFLSLSLSLSLHLSLSLTLFFIWFSFQTISGSAFTIPISITCVDLGCDFFNTNPFRAFTTASWNCLSHCQNRATTIIDRGYDTFFHHK